MRELTCRRCSSEVLEVRTGSGFEVLLDPAALDPLAELRAVLAGRATYTRHTYRGDVHARLPGTIRARPAGSRPRQEVHVEHACASTPAGGTMHR